MTANHATVRRAPVTIGRTATIRAAALEMEHKGVGSLLVLDDDRLVGIVTDRDIVLRGVARGVPGDGRIDALMTTEVLTVPAGTAVERARELFRDHAIRRLPVVDGRRVVGLLSVDDLLIRAGDEIADLVHPLADEVFAPHHEPCVPVAENAGRGQPAPESRSGREAMRGHPGDRLVVHRHRADLPDRVGEIVEVRSPAGDPPFAVRWSESGEVTFVYPGGDAEVQHRGQDTSVGAAR